LRQGEKEGDPRPDILRLLDYLKIEQGLTVIASIYCHGITDKESIQIQYIFLNFFCFGEHCFRFSGFVTVFRIPNFSSSESGSKTLTTGNVKPTETVFIMNI
jgi:hypothetical protein